MERIIHLHVPKTAGTAFKVAMETCPDRVLRVFPFWQEDDYHTVNPDDYDFYSGHFGFDTASRLNGRVVTILRSPIDRFVSVYYFWQNLYRSGAEVRPATILADRYSLREFAKIRDIPSLTEEFFNRATFQIADGNSNHHRETLRIEGKTEDEILKMAIENISGFAALGVQHGVPEFEREIKRTFGLSITLGDVNRNPGRQPTLDVDVATQREILDWVYIDMQLYDFVANLCWQRREAIKATPPPVPERDWARLTHIRRE